MASLLLAGLLAGGQAAPAPAPPPPRDEIVVKGERPRGSVAGTIPPERTLSSLDIRAYGANNVQELLQSLGAAVSSGRGRGDAGPAVLLNGRRVSSFNEIASIPTEAIERTEILPEAVALAYGFAADRKVVNIVTRERFSSTIGQATFGMPTEGGQATIGATANLLRLQGDTRTMLQAEYNRSSALTEDERDIVQPGDPATARARTLLPETRRAALGGTVAGTPLGEVAATLDARVETLATRALVGRGADGVLRRDGDSTTAHLGTTLGGRMAKWLWTATATLDRTRSDTATDTGIAAAPRNDARFTNMLAQADLLVNGSPFALPAGNAALSLRGGVATRIFDSRSRLGETVGTASLGRDAANVQASIDLLLTRSVGLVSLNANAALERLSDAGSLRTLGGGVQWTPVAGLTLLGSLGAEQSAPSVEQLGSPLLVLPNARTFDALRGETVDATRILGGNRALRPDDRYVTALGLSWQPWAKTDFTLTADYIRTRIDDPIVSFPLLTPAVEAAFPDRVMRDAGGRLQRIDATPVNFARSEQQELRWGLRYVRPLGPLPPGVEPARVRTFSSEAEVRRRLPPGARIQMIEAGSPQARRFENLMSRLMFSIDHVWRWQDRVVLPGGGVLDLLDGDALDLRGGRARHSVEAQAGAFKRGLGARITARWQAGTTLHAPGGDLRFGDLATVDLNLFANIADQMGGTRAPRWARGARLSLGIANLFEARQEVRDATGATPIAFQQAYLNPLGRTVALSLRKVF
ncbi:MAG: TonB-dependent receptor [Sphingomonas hengshuiensis]|uniref:TonB-dependent receptor n=1 Tax=Sphingomonas hengshuiensis TaxID=1609977 RepID=A0A2W5AYL6_9SPHN|nr:MAG: TonB-dependent receptor [Sphingomonas hengshuiensis]